MTIVHKQVFITAEQNRRLKAQARATGLAKAQLIRRALDQELGLTVAAENWKERLNLVLDEFKEGEFEAFAQRVVDAKQMQRELWAKRVLETRRNSATVDGVVARHLRLNRFIA